LSAVAVGAVILQSGKLADPGEPIDVGVDGSLVEHYPHFREMIYEALACIEGIGEEGANRVRIGIAKDGSGVGAALIALVAAGMEPKRSTEEFLKEMRVEVNVTKERHLSTVPEAGESAAFV